MSDYVKMLEIMPDFICGKGVSDKQISEAEHQLGVEFAEEYRLYLKQIGVAGFDGRELTGLGMSEHTNVVLVTLNERMKSEVCSNDLYVIEELNIDNIVIWQDANGIVYESVNGTNFKKIYNSLLEYLSEE